MASDLTGAERCVAHPARPAVDHCPTCDRPRCGADASGSTCTLCAQGSSGDGRSSRAASAAPSRWPVVRGAVVGLVLALVAGEVLSEYVGSPLFAYLAPAVAGVGCAEAVGVAVSGRAGRRGVGRRVGVVRTMAVVTAVLATGLGFFFEGSYAVLAPKVQVLVPYVLAAAAAWLWSAPPRRLRAS